jgi:hypothetical protein
MPQSELTVPRRSILGLLAGLPFWPHVSWKSASSAPQARSHKPLRTSLSGLWATFTMRQETRIISGASSDWQIPKPEYRTGTLRDPQLELTQRLLEQPDGSLAAEAAVGVLRARRLCIEKECCEALQQVHCVFFVYDFGDCPDENGWHIDETKYRLTGRLVSQKGIYRPRRGHGVYYRGYTFVVVEEPCFEITGLVIVDQLPKLPDVRFELTKTLPAADNLLVPQINTTG